MEREKREITHGVVQGWRTESVPVTFIHKAWDVSTEYGGEAVEKWLFEGQVGDAQLGYLINLEGDYCQHEYDCCGQYYRSGATVYRDRIRTLVVQRSYQNV